MRETMNGGGIALPTCRNYWRLRDWQPSVHTPKEQHAVILGRHAIPTFDTKYDKKARRGLSPHPSDFRYRIREPFNPSPFRGAAMIGFWILFALILLFIGLMISTTIYFGITEEVEEEGPVGLKDGGNTSSIILNAIFRPRGHRT